MRYAAALLIVFGLIFGGPALAQQKHKALQDLEERGYSVAYLGDDFGLDGWLIVSEQGQAQYGYSNSEGAFILGMLFDPQAQLHTAKQLQEYRALKREGGQAALKLEDQVQQSAAPVSEKIYADVEKAKWFSVGNVDAPYIYTFINPTCDHCHDFWTDHMKALVDQGTIQIRFIPFGATDENRDKSAVLLSAEDSEALWRQFAAGDAAALDNSDDIPEGLYQAVDFNTAVFKKWDLPLLPFTIYRAPVDGEVKVIAGVPDNSMMLLADFTR